MTDLVPSAEETLDRLAGSWHLFQLRRGHRFSTDDVAVAWRASFAHPQARRLLDIGCGIGSVGLLLLHRLGRESPDPGRTLTGVEVQAVSVGLARRTVRVNDLSARVSVVHGDLRDPGVLPTGARFDLITGSPPYIPEGHGVMSPVAQRAGARMELRGSIHDYCAAARRWLAPGGRFVFVMPSADARTEDAPVANGFAVLERWDFVFRGGAAPHISTLTCARVEDGPFPERRTGSLDVRGPDGRWTAAYERLRHEWDLQG